MLICTWAINGSPALTLKTGERTWTSKPFGKYASLVAQRDRILALDERGVWLLIKANPKEFELLSEKQISEDDTWAHLAVSGDELFIRELNALAAWRWRTPARLLANDDFRLCRQPHEHKQLVRSFAMVCHTEHPRGE